MLQNYFVKQVILAVVCTVAISFVPAINTMPIWLALGFINALFAVLYFIANESLKAQSHKDFVTIFGVLFSVKVGSVLTWLLIAIFHFHLRSNVYLLSFFALYLSYTFLWAWQLFSQTKKK